VTFSSAFQVRPSSLNPILSFTVVNFFSIVNPLQLQDRKPWGNSTLDYLSGKSPLLKT
jgi:hypothetical protein